MAKFKTTEAIEKERLQLWNDYKTYQKVEQSDELKNYLALKEKVESIPFLEKKKEIEALRFKGSPEEKMLKEYQKLERNRKLLSYFETKPSVDLERFNAILESESLEQMAELETFVKRGQFKTEMQKFKKLKKADKENKDVWEKTEAYLKKKKYDDLKSSPNVLFYKRFIKSKVYKNFLAIDDSTLLHQYEDLKVEIESDKFRERKAYLEDVKRYENTEDYKTLSEFEKLDSKGDIQLYLKYNDTDAFKFFREWTLTFEEDFKKIDTKIWKFVTPIGLKGPGRNFSLKNQLHYANNSDNFDFENGIFTLETKKEKINGIYWDEKYGFVPKEFKYASGLIHTLGGFEQEYGHFEIKVKASKVKGVLSSISLVDADEDTCIRLFSSNSRTPQGGIVTTDHLIKNFDPVNLACTSKGYVLVALIWSPEKLEWMVNDKLVGSITNNVPHVSLGLRIETEVLKETNNLPHRLDIDWIKCYKRN